jgi:hypothetical protein
MRRVATPAYEISQAHDEMLCDISRAFLFAKGFTFRCDVDDGVKLSVYTKKLTQIYLCSICNNMQRCRKMYLH